MRKTYLQLLVLGLLLAACSVRQPKIALEADRFDFGELVNGVVVTKELAVRNEGDATLVIEAVSTSCGCTKARVEHQNIEPGSQTTLHIEYDTGAHGPDLIGPLTRQVFIASNDPDQMEVVLEFDSLILPKGS